MNKDLKNKILKIMDDHYPEIAVMMIANLLKEENGDPLKIEKTLQIINCFENSQKERDYTSVYTWNDGPNKQKQITISTGFTQAGNAQRVVKEYIKNDGRYAEEFSKYDWDDLSLSYNRSLISKLKKAGEEKAMRDAQDKVYQERYIDPALKWFHENGFTKPLSFLVIFDSFLHSGSIMGFLRKRFSARPPASGGLEQEWIEQYIDTRHSWLWSKGGQLRTSSYRTKCLKEQIRKDNWDLEQPVNANGVIVE